ncbi:uncharacterized protein DS421_13g416650 [Arachis hypogaea]|nr:uncharacterized protein DS421_13g416650 [Arachis hypogaea]
MASSSAGSSGFFSDFFLRCANPRSLNDAIPRGYLKESRNGLIFSRLIFFFSDFFRFFTLC